MTGCRSIRFIASAGTGKTHQVVSLYQSLLLGRPYPPDAGALPDIAAGAIFDGQTRVPPERILMLTFTRNAAAEMRSRVTEAIERELATGDASNEAFCWSLLRRLSGATISTIHAFAQQLIAAHTLQLGLSPALTILEEAEADDLRNKAIQSALKTALATPDPTAHDLETLCDGRGVEGIQDGLRVILRKCAAWGIDLEATPPATLVPLPSQPTVRDLEDILREVGPAADAHGGRKLEAMAHGLADAIKRLGPGSSTDAVVAAARDLAPLTKGTWGHDAQVKELRERVKDRLMALQAHPAHVESRRLLMVLLELARECARAIRRLKHDQGVLDFDDLLFAARDLIDSTPSCIPPVQVIIVDEAQDNSRLQNDLVALIANRTRASVIMCGDTKQTIYGWRGADPDGLPRFAGQLNLDPIPLRTSYRSQKGVVDWVNDIFAGVVMKTGLYGEAETLQPCPAAANLGGPAVELLLPEWECRPKPDQLITVDDKNTNLRIGLTGSNLRTLAGRDSQGEWQRIVDRSEQALALEARALARRIRLLVNATTDSTWLPEQVWDSPSLSWRPPSRPAYRYRDILVLLRATTRQELYEQALQEEGIPFTTDGKGRGFFARQETLDLSNLLNWLAFPTDKLAYVGVLRSPFVALSDSAVALIEHTFGNAGSPEVDSLLSGANLVCDAQTWQRARPVLHTLRALAGRVSAVELVRHAIHMTGYDAILAGTFHGVQRLANLQKLLSWIQDHERSETLDLQALARRLSGEITRERQSPDAAVLDPDDDSVRINTVHAAKGLSSPVVIIPDLRRAATADRDWITLTHDASGSVTGVSGKFRLFGVDTDEEATIECEGFAPAVEQGRIARDAESRRLFYVACTRARDLIVLSGENPSRGDSSAWRSWVNAHLIQCAFNPNLVRLRTYGEVETAWRSCCPARAPESRPVTAAQLLAVSSPLPGAVAPEQYRFPITALTHPLPAVAMAPVVVVRASSEAGPSGDLPDTAPDPAPTPTDEPDRARLGTLAHRVLETLDYGSTESLDNQIRRAFAAHGHHAPSGATWMPRITRAARTLAELLQGVPSHDLIREMPFAARFDHDGARLIVDGKVDLLFRKDGVWHIVDYKFSDQGAEDLASQYSLQLAAYQEALAAPGPDPTLRMPRFVPGVPAPFKLLILGAGADRVTLVPITAPAPEETRSRLLEAARAYRYASSADRSR